MGKFRRFLPEGIFPKSVDKIRFQVYHLMFGSRLFALLPAVRNQPYIGAWGFLGPNDREIIFRKG